MRRLIRIDTAQLSQAVGEAVDAHKLSERVALAADKASPGGADLIIDRREERRWRHCRLARLFKN